MNRVVRKSDRKTKYANHGVRKSVRKENKHNPWLENRIGKKINIIRVVIASERKQNICESCG